MKKGNYKTMTAEMRKQVRALKEANDKKESLSFSTVVPLFVPNEEKALETVRESEKVEKYYGATDISTNENFYQVRSGKTVRKNFERVLTKKREKGRRGSGRPTYDDAGLYADITKGH